MINDDYILRMAELFGRELAIILRLRKRDRYEDALIYINELLLRFTGLRSGLINSLPEEMLLNMISPAGILNVEKCLWIATLLKEEGDIFLIQGKANESYHRHLKSLDLFLELMLHDADLPDLDIDSAIEHLVERLEEYELPFPTQQKLFHCFEKSGKYARAENLLFEMLEEHPADITLIEEGTQFYARLKQQNDENLLQGDFSRQEIEEGLAAFQKRIQE